MKHKLVSIREETFLKIKQKIYDHPDPSMQVKIIGFSFGNIEAYGEKSTIKQVKLKVFPQ